MSRIQQNADTETENITFDTTKIKIHFDIQRMLLTDLSRQVIGKGLD